MCFKKNGPVGNRPVKERLKELTASNELATTEYKVAKVVKAEDNPHLLGDKKILYSCNVYIKAGINLEDYDPSRTVIDEASGSISIVLPHAKLLSFNMPAEEQTLEYEKVSVMRRQFTAHERNELLVQGEESVRDQICDMGILEDAERNTRDIFRAALMPLGFHTINIQFE